MAPLWSLVPGFTHDSMVQPFSETIPTSGAAMSSGGKTGRPGGSIVPSGIVMVVTCHQASALPIPEFGIDSGPNSTYASPGRPSLTSTRTVDSGLPPWLKLFIHTSYSPGMEFGSSSVIFSGPMA